MNIPVKKDTAVDAVILRLEPSVLILVMTPLAEF